MPPDKENVILRVITLSSVLLVLVFAGPARAERPPNCSKRSPHAELRCAHRQLHQARRELSAPFASPPHSRGYWLWRVKVAKRWVRQAHHRLSQRLPMTNDWVTAVRIVQRDWPGSAAWLLSCSAGEGGHGQFVMNRQGSSAGGWMQYMPGTFYGHLSSALAQARASHLALPPSQARTWTSPLGQAFAAGWAHNYTDYHGPWAPSIDAGCA